MTRHWKGVIKSIKLISTIFEWFIFATLVFTFLVVLSPLLPTKRYIYTYIVATGSMEPTIKTGSIALVKPAKVETLKKGDIITFTSPKDSKLTILHRIFEVKKDGSLTTFLTKGDNNNAQDRWNVSPALVKGQYIASIPYLGHPAALLKTKNGFILMIVVPAIILALLQIKTIKEGVDEEVERRTKKALENMKKKKNPMISIIILVFILNGFVYYGANNYVKALFVSTATATGVTFSVKDFVPPPAPTLVLPANNSYRNTSGMVMDWSDVTDYLDMHNLVYYIYQSSHNLLFSPLTYQSGHLSTSQIPAPGTPNGIYYWRVKACDSLDNCSEWSDVWKVTVDNTPPSLPGQIGWTTENPPVGSDFSGGSDFDRYQTCGGVVSYSPMTNLWGPATDNFGPVSYEREVYNPTDSNLIYQSNLTNNYENGGGAVDDQTYWVRIRAKDATGNYSDWTSKCSVMYDATKPTSIITTPANTGSNSIVYSSSWDGNIAGTVSDDRSGVNRVDLSIYRASDNTYWNGSSWQIGTESSVRVTATDTANWTYFLSDHTTTTYTITSHAVDNAGNIEGSYILTLICKNPPETNPSLSLTINDDKKSALFKVNDIKDYKKLSYELTYYAYDVQKGVVGSDVDLTGKNEFSKEIDLATCSDAVCTYDQDVKNFQLTIILKDKDGKETTVESKL